MKHVAMELEIVVGWAWMATLLASDLLSRVEREEVQLQGQLAIEGVWAAQRATRQR